MKLNETAIFSATQREMFFCSRPQQVERLASRTVVLAIILPARITTKP